MFTPLEKNFTIYQGATFFHGFQLQINNNGAVTPLDLTNWSARMQIREKTSSSAVAAELTTENGGIVFEEDRDGEGQLIESRVHLVLHPPQTDALTLKRGVYDLEMVDPLGNVGRILQGAVTIIPQVTR